MLLIPLFLVFWMPDSHISDVYLACKRKNIQITLQNVSQAYFPSNSTAHAVSFVLVLTKMYSTPSELFEEWLENLESLLPCEDRNERQTGSHGPWIKQGIPTLQQEWNQYFKWSFSWPTWKNSGWRGFRSLDVINGTPLHICFYQQEMTTVQHIRKGSGFVMLISSCCCKEQSLNFLSINVFLGFYTIPLTSLLTFARERE